MPAAAASATIAPASAPRRIVALGAPRDPPIRSPDGTLKQVSPALAVPASAGPAQPSDRLQPPVRQRRQRHPDGVARPQFTALASTTAIYPPPCGPAGPRPAPAPRPAAPGLEALDLAQGLRSPVTSATAVAPRCSRAPAGRPSRSIPRAATFSPNCPGATRKPPAASSPSNSSCSRWSWRRFGWLGSRATGSGASPSPWHAHRRPRRARPAA